MPAMILRHVGPFTCCLFAASVLVAAGCKDGEPEKTQVEPQPAETAKKTKPQSSAKKPSRADAKELAERRKAIRERLEKKKLAAKPVAKVPVSEGDPEKGEFTLVEATKGLPAEGALMADILTDEGTLSCELYEDKAPITVANFVGLARGLRAHEKDGKWLEKPFYDNTTFHRVIKGFMIQGGDPLGNGTGGPGYVIPDEIWAGAKHDKRGLLCMANSGPNTNGSQFFIMDGKASHLDGGYTIFGMCEPPAVIEKLASTPVKGDRAVKPPKIKKITIKRDKSKPRREAPGTSGTDATEAAPTATGGAKAVPVPLPSRKEGAKSPAKPGAPTPKPSAT